MRVWWSLVLLLALPARAQFQRTIAGMSGNTTLCVTWSDRNFDYRADAAGSAKIAGDSEFTAIDAAFSSWQAVSNSCSDFQFVRGARLPDGTVGKGTESANLIIFRDVDCRDVVQPTDPCLADGSCGNAKRCWDHSSGTIGLTTVTYSTRTGIAVDADIELNSADFVMTTISSPPCTSGNEMPTCVAYDVQNTLTHEIGHAVGLDHVENPGSTMAPTAPVGETSKRVIDIGTANGFCSTYPRGQPPVPCDELAVQSSKIIAQSTGSCAASSVGSWPLVALLGLWLVRRSRS